MNLVGITITRLGERLIWLSKFDNGFCTDEKMISLMADHIKNVQNTFWMCTAQNEVLIGHIVHHCREKKLINSNWNAYIQPVEFYIQIRSIMKQNIKHIRYWFNNISCFMCKVKHDRWPALYLPMQIIYLTNCIDPIISLCFSTILCVKQFLVSNRNEIGLGHCNEINNQCVFTSIELIFS